MAMRQNCTSISYTYNEPLINLDYVEDVAKIASDNKVKNTLVTNGYISLPALNRVVDLFDAANVDWKAFNESFYRKYCSADLGSVLDATIEMKKKDVHVEVTFLIIPETNDDRNEIRDMARFLVENLGPETPLHLSRFFPHHMFNHLPSTPLDTLIEARDIAKEEGVWYVFVGNVPYSEYDNTYCHCCDKPVIERVGYSITEWNLDEENNCEYCGESIPIIGTREINKSKFSF
jgi:pyruvate formate lyase activating enzyme